MQAGTTTSKRVYFGSGLGPIVLQYNGGGGLYRYIIEFDGGIVADSGVVSGPGQISFKKETATMYGLFKIIRF